MALVDGARMIELTGNLATNEPVPLSPEEETAGHEARFTALVERQSRFVFRVAYAIVRNPQLAEDVVQETFLKLYRTGAWERMEDERAFLACAAWRIAVRKRRRPEAELDERTPSPAASPEAMAVAADWNEVVRRLVDALPEELRQPLALSAVEGLTSREIAAIMAIAEGTVRTRMMRARRILREKLAPLGGGKHGR